MKSDVPLDYAVFQLSPRQSRCELFVSYDGTTEKLASGLVKPFVSNLKAAEEQVALASKSVKLDVDGFSNAETWFTKGTLERFVRFVSTPEVLEMVNAFDAEVSQLEAARKIYYQGAADDGFGKSGGIGNGATVASDTTKNELLRAIDVRLSAVKQDLVTACSRASSAGFIPETVSGLQSFANHFGAHRLSEACSLFMTNSHRRADLFNSENILCSSDMSLDDSFNEQPKSSIFTTSKITASSRRFSRELNPNSVDMDEKESSKDKSLGSTAFAATSTTESVSTSSGKPQLTRKLSVHEKISLFETKAQVSPSTISTTTTTTPTSMSGKPEFRRLSMEVKLSTDKAVVRRWSGASDMRVDVSGERKEPNSNANTPSPSSAPSPGTILPPISKDLSDLKSVEGDRAYKLPASAAPNSMIPSLSKRSSEKDQFSVGLRSKVTSFGKTEEIETDPSSQISTNEKQKGVLGGGSVPHGVPNNYMLQFSEFQMRTAQSDIESANSRVHSQPVIRKIEVEGVPTTKSGGRNESSSKESSGQNEEVFPSVPKDQVSKVIRQPKGNQGVNDELKIKANELEKLFAEHKLRVPGDQSSSTPTVGPSKTAKEVEAGLVNRIQEPKASPPACSSSMKPMGELTGSSTPMLKNVDNHNCDVRPKHNVRSLNFSDGSGGKSYQKYMQKRNAKLREDWSLNRREKEAQLKAMQKALEESSAEMKLKLAGSAAKKLPEKLLGDSSTKSAQTIRSKRLQLNKNTSSPSTRQPTTSTRTPTKTSNPAAERRRLPNDNHLPQSVPSFTSRKENTKSSSLGSKSVRPLGRVHARRKSTSEDLPPLVNEEKPQRSQSLRKNSLSTAEFNTSRNFDDADDTKFMSSKYHSEENEDYEEIAVGQITGSGTGTEEETVDVTENKEHDRETTLLEESTHVDSNAIRFDSQARLDSAEDMPTIMSLLFHSLGTTPEESPGSWNPGQQNPFSFSHEILDDIDASDSPSGSPDTLSQSEVEARMRKQWGAARKPVVIPIDSSHSQSRKDITKGLKRFLNFGRKNRASESLADWISVATSEGDDSEDGRDLANRSSEDLRKSRMGFSQSHNSYDGFHDTIVFNQQVDALESSIPTPPSNFKLKEENLSATSLKAPKSFFSLSNFRSKANDSKPR